MTNKQVKHFFCTKSPRGTPGPPGVPSALGTPSDLRSVPASRVEGKVNINIQSKPGVIIKILTNGVYIETLLLKGKILKQNQNEFHKLVIKTQRVSFSKVDLFYLYQRLFVITLRTLWPAIRQLPLFPADWSLRRRPAGCVLVNLTYFTGYFGSRGQSVETWIQLNKRTTLLNSHALTFL